MDNFYKKGITVVEILVVIAVIGILFSVTMPQFSKMREKQVLKSSVGDILSSISKARAQTLASVNSSVYGVRFESDKVIIFTGIVFSADVAGNETINITTPASITNVTLNSVSATPGEMYFSRLSGAPSKTGTIAISTTNYSKTITISATGIASVN